MPPSLPLNSALLQPGLRLAVGLSGGADSVALLRLLAQQGRELGLVLSAAHLHHGLRGAEADADLAFCRALAADLGLPFHASRVDVAAAAQPSAAKPAESIEEAARRLRYDWFRQLMAEGVVDAVATAHTRDDQAETVLAKFLRGAWTEGLGGIHPTVQFPEGRILRPLLAASRAQIVAYLGSLGQPWREDSSNSHLVFTRNRIRHELLPLLESWNPQLRDHLAQMATLARDEDAFWQAELAQITPQILLTGRPVRGGGRASGPESTLVLDLARLAALHPALQRRLLRSVAQQLGAALDFAATESLRALALDGRAGQKLQLEGLHAERTHRELRLDPAVPEPAAQSLQEFSVLIPGQIEAPLFDLRLRVELIPPAPSSVNVANDNVKGTGFNPYSHEAKSTRSFAPEGSPSGDSAHIACQIAGAPGPSPLGTGDRTNPDSTDSSPIATLRNWRPGDRVHLRYSSGPRKVKEVLDRLKVTGSARALWPVLELNGHILWMKGVELEPTPGLRILAEPRDSSS